MHNKVIISAMNDD